MTPTNALRIAIVAALAFSAVAAFANGDAPVKPPKPSKVKATAIALSASSASSASNASASASAPTSIAVDNTVLHERSVASAVAPALTAANGTCLGSAGIGAQGASFGLSVGSTKLDEGCDARFDAIALMSMGDRAGAIARLCMKPEIRAARKMTGQFCPEPLPEPAVGQVDAPRASYEN